MQAAANRLPPRLALTKSSGVEHRRDLRCRAVGPTLRSYRRRRPRGPRRRRLLTGILREALLSFSQSISFFGERVGRSCLTCRGRPKRHFDKIFGGVKYPILRPVSPVHLGGQAAPRFRRLHSDGSGELPSSTELRQAGKTRRPRCVDRSASGWPGRSPRSTLARAPA